MIPIDDPTLYDASLAALRVAVGGAYLGRPAQMFLAAKHYGKAIPQIGDPAGLQTSEFEDLLDDLYLKPSRSTDEMILILFEAAHRVPSRVKAGGLAGPSNIWRNNLNFQKGYMCFGSEAELLDPAFRNPSRLQCPHLQPKTGTLAGATCELRPGPQQPKYRGEDHPKMFRKSPKTGEYWIYDPSDSAFYGNLVLPTNGLKLPVAALIIALYFDGKLAAGRQAVGIADFLSDFAFSDAEYALYFEDDPASQAHKALLAVHPGLQWTRHFGAAVASPQPSAQGGTAALPPLPQPLPPKTKKDAGAAPTTTLTSTAAPPAGSHWWSAEQAVRNLLEGDGWHVLDVSRLGIGYDLKATKNGIVRLVEVKSAIGPCAPTLTNREYKEARQSRQAYILAIVENFDPNASVNVLWVRDPASLQMTERKTVEYYLPRSVWTAPATTLFPN